MKATITLILSLLICVNAYPAVVTKGTQSKIKIRAKRHHVHQVRALLPVPKTYTLPVMPRMLMAKAIVDGVKAVSYPPTIIYPPSAVVVQMYFTNHPAMGRKVYAYANHPSGERWSMQTSSGFYGGSLLWFTPPSYEDTETQVRVTVPVNPSGFYFRAVKHR